MRWAIILATVALLTVGGNQIACAKGAATKSQPKTAPKAAPKTQAPLAALPELATSCTYNGKEVMRIIFAPKEHLIYLHNVSSAQFENRYSSIADKFTVNGDKMTFSDRYADNEAKGYDFVFNLASGIINNDDQVMASKPLNIVHVEYHCQKLANYDEELAKAKVAWNKNIKYWQSHSDSKNSIF